MPDVHLSEEVCTGTVVATRRLLYPNAVGNDIGCGMAALRFHGNGDPLADERAAAQLLAGLYRLVPAIRHGRATAPLVLPSSLADEPLSDGRLEKLKSRDGRVEFATLGRGNHFVEFQTDEANQLWLMLHSGSRAMGRAIKEHHLANACPSGSGLQYLDADSDAGRAYLADLAWACRYAQESRQAMVATVAEVW